MHFWRSSNFVFLDAFIIISCLTNLSQQQSSVPVLHFIFFLLYCNLHILYIYFCFTYNTSIHIKIFLQIMAVNSSFNNLYSVILVSIIVFNLFMLYQKHQHKQTFFYILDTSKQTKKPERDHYNFFDYVHIDFTLFCLDSSI